MSNGFSFRQTSRTPGFRAWLEETTRRTHGGSEADTVRRAISYRGPVPLGGGELPSDSTVWR